jgi:hypothetical protein
MNVLYVTKHSYVMARNKRHSKRLTLGRSGVRYQVRRNQRSMKRNSLLLPLGLFLALNFIGTAQASLLATDWGTTSNLYSLNTTTGVAALIGSTGQILLIGLVVDADSTIYSISEEANSRLWTLNPNTGAATLVGSLGFNLQEGDMTISPVSGQMYVADGAGDTLYTVNKATGAATLVGSFGAAGRDVSGLQFIGSTLYGLALNDSAPDALVTVNPLTGLATTVGITGTNFGVIAAMGRDPGTGLTYIAGPSTSFGDDNQLYSINLTTGAATLVHSISGVTSSISGFSVAGNPSILLPEPGGLLLAGIGLAALVGLRRRR